MYLLAAYRAYVSGFHDTKCGVSDRGPVAECTFPIQRSQGLSPNHSLQWILISVRSSKLKTKRVVLTLASEVVVQHFMQQCPGHD
jgi:hypothetical protein